MSGYTHGKQKLTKSNARWPRPSPVVKQIGVFNWHDSTYISDIVKYIRSQGVEVKRVIEELEKLYGVRKVSDIPEHLALSATLFFTELGKATGYPYVDEF